MPLNFIGVADLAVFMDVDVNTLDLANANLAVAAAQQAIRKYLSQELTYHAGDVVYLDGNGRKKIRLPERPVIQVTKVEEGSGDPTWTELDSDAYLLREDILIRWDGDVWRFGEALLRVTYDHGWHVGSLDSDISDSDFDTGLNSLPADISLVALSAARRSYDNLGAASGAGTAGQIKQETIGAYSYTLSSAAEKAAGVALLGAEKDVLNNYREEGAG